MASAFPFSMKTLNDNWFEDRHQPKGSLTGTGDIKGTPRPYEQDIASFGDRPGILARIARVPPKESFALPDCGFKDNFGTATADFAPPRSRKEFIAKPPDKPQFITAETIPEVCYEERRPVPGNIRGFGAVLNRHDEADGKRTWSTTSEATYGTPLVSARLKAERIDPGTLGRAAGVGTEDEEERVIGMKVGKLTGEDFRDCGEPSCDTRTQRAWLYNCDPSLTNIEYGGNRPQVARTDNELSIPLGEGAMKKVRDDIKGRKGMLYRTATLITKGAGERSGMAVFQDD